MTASAWRWSGGAIVVLALAACTAQSPPGRTPATPDPTRQLTAAPTASPSGGPARRNSLIAIVTKDENLSPAAGAFGAPLAVYRTLAGPDAFRASGIAPMIPPGFEWAMLTEFDDDDEHVGDHEGQYRSFVARFQTAADAERALEAVIAFHQTAAAWGFFSQPGIKPIAFLGDEGVHFTKGDDYGYPVLSVYLWRRDTMVLQAVDFHPYDRPGLLRSIARSMDLRAADARD